jgi:hypothetical protein
MPQHALQVVVEDLPEDEHAHRFGEVSFHGIRWDLSHLDSFNFKVDLELGAHITVPVLLSCRCFSHSFRWDKRLRGLIPAHEIYDDGREQRVLDPQQYELSRRFLKDVVVSLPSRRIVLADERQPNFVTVESLNADGTTSLYAIFFEAQKDKSRKRRMILRIQSAYPLNDGLTKRQTSARRIAFTTLLRATYLGKKIRG